MKILLISFYFPPDLSAGSFRAKALIGALRERGPADLEIDVITTSPNRYSSLIGIASSQETADGVTITRLAIPAHKSGMVDQARSFISFAKQVRTFVSDRHWDVVIGTSSRLMTAALSAAIAKKTKAALYLDIRDLFTDTMGDLLSASPLRLVLPAVRVIERRVFRSASRINIVSGGFLPHMRKIAPGHDYRVFTNGIDDEFLTGFDPKPERKNGQVSVLFYAGNMGEGQGLHNIVPAAAAMLGRQADFLLIGDGGRRKQLENELHLKVVTNVEVRDPVPREAVSQYYKDADILFLHLNDQNAFLKVLPSKLFEYAATGKPMLTGVAGHAAEFIKNEIPGAEVFAPCDAGGMIRAFERLKAGPTYYDRSEFCKKYARRAIMARMADDILDLARSDAK